MKIRAKKCNFCGHKTGLLNKTCSERDSTNLEIFEYTSEHSVEPRYVVTVVRNIVSMEEGLTWHRSLLENLKPFNIWYDGHEVEILKAVEESVMMSAGEFTMYWNYSVEDGKKAIELIAALMALRPGLMELSLIEIEYHDTVELE